MINFENAHFVTSFAGKPSNLDKDLPELLFVGRSNCGKSSLINALCKKNRLAFTSSTPGYTKLLNYFEVDNKFYIVDAPGYGFAKNRDKSYVDFGELMDNYLENNSNLKLVLVLLDARRIPNEDDVSIINYLIESKIPYIICYTKMDKLNMSEKAKISKNLNAVNLKIPADLQYFTSSVEEKYLTKLRNYINEIID